jgi:hypothetical protein
MRPKSAAVRIWGLVGLGRVVGLLGLGGVIGLSGCVTQADEAIEEPVASQPDSAASSLDGSLVDGSPFDASPEGDPFPDLVGEGQLLSYELSLVNRTEADLIIHASAGADRVVLDTVPGHDSTRVNLQIRARRITLEAEDGAGHTAGFDVLELVPAGQNRWEIRPGGE